MRSFAEAYGRGVVDAQGFLPCHFADARERAVVLAQRTKVPAHFPAVAAELRAQNASYGQSPARLANLHALSHEGALAVVTGQQVGLLGGPLLSFFKAATAIKVARALEAECGTRVVPIFWLQSEDHDFDEVAACHLLNGAGQLHTITVASEDGVRRTSMQHRYFQDASGAMLDEAMSLMGTLPHAEEVSRLLAQHYRSGAGWVEAFGGLLAEVFADEGLLTFHPRTAGIARVAAPLHRLALERSDRLGKLLVQQAERLLDGGFRCQVTPRPECSLSFYHPTGPTGPRYRLRHTPEGFTLAGSDDAFATEDVLAALKNDPLRFSTSALLRPMLQDYLLPTAAYVGGPAEIAYFAQIAPLYDELDISMPLVMPRLHGVLADHKCQRLAHSFGVSPAAVPGSAEALLDEAGVAAPGPASDEVVATLLHPFAAELENLAPLLHSLSPDLRSAIEKTRNNVTQSVHKLGERVDKARRLYDAERAQRAQALVAWCHPGGNPQERVLAFIYAAARVGVHRLKEATMSAYEPFAVGVREIAL